MNLTRQTLPVFVRGRKRLQLPLSLSSSVSETVRRFFVSRTTECNSYRNNKNVLAAQVSPTVRVPAVPVSVSVLPDSKPGTEYVQLVEEEVRKLATWKSTAFLFSLLQGLRLALVHLGNQRNPDLEIVVTFLDVLGSKSSIYAGYQNQTLSIRQLPQKIVKLPDHYFNNESTKGVQKKKIFPNVPFYVSSELASEMKKKMKSDHWKDFIAYFLNKIYGDDLMYLTAVGKKNTQGIHPFVLEGLVAFASKKDNTISESDVKIAINQITCVKKLSFIRAHQTANEVELDGQQEGNTTPHHEASATAPTETLQGKGSEVSDLSAGAEYVQLVEQEIRQHASRENVDFMNCILKNLRVAIATHWNRDLELLVSFFDTLVSKTNSYNNEKEIFRTCQQPPQKIVELPSHYFVNKEEDKIPKVQIFPGIQFFVSPALAVGMEQRKNNWKDFSAVFLERVYGDDIIYLTARGRGGKQGVHPLILQGLVEHALRVDSSASWNDVMKRISRIIIHKKHFLTKKLRSNVSVLNP